MPVYIQLKNLLKKEIEEGLYDLTLPSERKLAEKHHVVVYSIFVSRLGSNKTS